MGEFNNRARLPRRQETAFLFHPRLRRKGRFVLIQGHPLWTTLNSKIEIKNSEFLVTGPQNLGALEHSVGLVFPRTHSSQYCSVLVCFVHHEQRVFMRK